MPELEKGDAPLYLALAEAILADIVSGRLAPGSRLPNQRDLAASLGASVGTVTRAYQLAEARGAIESTPGRGSFVRRSPAGTSPVGASLSLEPGQVDLSVAHPPYSVEPDLGTALAAVSQAVDVQRFQRYQALEEVTRYRGAGLDWLRACGVETGDDAITLTSGAQHAGLVLLLAQSEPGDLVLVDRITYPGFLALAHHTRRRVRGIPMDRDGMIPEALDEACRENRPTLLYLIPTLHNPTGAVMPEARRRALSRVAEDHDLLVIEDDTLRMLAPDPPPTVTSLIPDRSFFIGSLSKAVSGGLRLAFLRAPRRHAEPLRAAAGATVFMTAPLLVEMAARWIEDGTALHTVARKRAEMEKRHGLAREILPTGSFQAEPQSFYLWLELSEGWTSAEFAAAARQRGVGITPSRPFAADPAESPAGVRVCLSAAETQDHLKQALHTLAYMLMEPQSRAGNLI